MSTKRSLWVDGQPITTTELSAMANYPSVADDNVYSNLLAKGGILGLGGSPLSTDRVCLANGDLGCQSTGTGVDLAFSAMVEGGIMASSTFINGPITPGANVSGSIRYDAIYAQVNRTITATGTRTVKSTIDGSLNPQTVNLEDQWQVTYVLIPGVASGSPFAGMPAQTATQRNFPLCRVAVPNGFPGTPITQASITQYWDRGYISASALRGMQVGSGGTPTGVTATTNLSTTLPLLSTRFGDRQRLVFPVCYKTINTYYAIDTTGLGGGGWLNRVISVKAMRFAGSGSTHPAPEGTPLPGADISVASGLVFTGISGLGPTSPIYTVLDNSAVAIAKIFIDTDGSTLVVKFVQASDDATSGDNWWFEFEVSGRFVF